MSRGGQMPETRARRIAEDFRRRLKAASILVEGDNE